MNTAPTLFTTALVYIKNNGVLLAYSNNKKAWYLPGGKIDAGETAITTLQREIKEELQADLDVTKLSFLFHISAPAYGEVPARLMEQEYYTYTADLKPIASKEIGAIRYFSFEEHKKEPAQVPGVLKLFELLRAVDNY